MILDQIIESYHSDTLKKTHTHTWNPPFHPMSGNALRMEILLHFTMWDIATNVKALGGSGEKLPMGETVPSFSSLIFPEFLMPRTSGNESLSFRTGSGGLFSWKQQTGVWLTVANVLPIWLYSQARSWYWFSFLLLCFGCVLLASSPGGSPFSQRNSKRKCRISAVKVLIRSGHNFNQTRDIPLVSVTICQMWQITPIFRNQEHHPMILSEQSGIAFVGLPGSLLTHRPLNMTVCLKDVFVFPLRRTCFRFFWGSFVFCWSASLQLFWIIFSWILCFESRTYKARGRIGIINFQWHKDFFIAVVKKKVRQSTTLEKIGIPTISYTHMNIYKLYNILYIYIYIYICRL